MIEFKENFELVDYEQACLFMAQRVNSIIKEEAQELIWFLEHPPIYTAGTSANISELLNSSQFPVYNSNRGGKYVYHGPGQLIAYIMLDLKKRDKKDVKAYVRNLESIIINALAKLGIDAFAREGRVGIWVYDQKKREKKIAAIGVRIQKWVTSHGIAININPNIDHYNAIIPCGIKEYGITSLSKLGIEITLPEFSKILHSEILLKFPQYLS